MDEKKRSVTQSDVAKHAGVTRSMVSYVLNGSDRSVAPETRQKILDAIKELGYRPNKYAQALMRCGGEETATNRIGIILNEPEVFLRPYYAEIIAGIYSAAHKNGYHVRFIRFFDELKNPILFNELIHTDEICALVLVSTDQKIETAEDRKIIESIRKQIDQIVCIEWQYDGLSSVSFDRQEAARKATDYLFSKGYTDIAYIGEEDNRITGFRQAFIEHGITDIARLHLEFAHDTPGGFFCMQKIHEDSEKAGARPLPNAVCCGSDEIAVGVLRYLNMKNIRVPEHIAVISIDDIEMAQYTNPALTTIHVQKAAMGERAVEMIVSGTAGQDEHALLVTLPTSMAVRQSV